MNVVTEMFHHLFVYSSDLETNCCRKSNALGFCTNFRVCQVFQLASRLVAITLSQGDK